MVDKNAPGRCKWKWQRGQYGLIRVIWNKSGLKWLGGEVDGTVIIGFARECRVWELYNPVFISVAVWRKVSMENQMEAKGRETFWFLSPLIWKIWDVERWCLAGSYLYFLDTSLSIEISHVISLGISHLSCNLFVSVVTGTCTDFTINQNLFFFKYLSHLKTILIIV